MKRAMCISLTLLLLLCALPAAQAQGADYRARVYVFNEMRDIIVYVGRILINEGPHGLTLLDPLSGEKASIQPADAAAWAALPPGRLLVDGETLYRLAYDLRTLHLLSLVGDSLLIQQELTLADLGAQYPQAVFIHQGELTLLAAGKLLILPLATGELRSLNLPDTHLIIPYVPGSYAALRQTRVEGSLQTELVAIDAKTGQVNPLVQVDAQLRVSSLAWQPGSPLVIEANTALWTLGEEGQLVKAASLVRGDVHYLSLLDQDRAVVGLDSLVAIRTINPALAPAQARLTLLDPLGRGEDYAGYISRHGDTELAFPTFSLETVEERYRRDMLTCADEVDIYLLSDQNLMATIKRKGYALDLSGDEMLRSFAQDLYPPFAAFLTQGASLYGIPKKAFLPVIAYNKDAFADLGLPLPTTWAEYFDLGLAWQTGLADEHTDYSFTPIDYYTTLDTLLTQYLDERAANGLPLVVNTQAVQELVGKYRQVAAASTSRREAGGIQLFTLVDVPYRGSEYQALPLRFDSASQPAFSLPPDSFNYFVVNPYTKNRAEAMAFLAAYVDSLSPYIRILLSQAVKTPVENPEYAARLAQLQSQDAQLMQQIKTAQGAQRSELESQQAIVLRQLQDLEEYERWDISAEDIAAYQAFSGQVYLNPFNPLPTLLTSYPDLFTAFEGNPEADIPAFLDRLDGMIATLLRESE